MVPYHVLFVSSCFSSLNGGHKSYTHIMIDLGMLVMLCVSVYNLAGFE